MKVFSLITVIAMVACEVPTEVEQVQLLEAHLELRKKVYPPASNMQLMVRSLPTRAWLAGRILALLFVYMKALFATSNGACCRLSRGTRKKWRSLQIRGPRSASSTFPICRSTRNIVDSYRIPSSLVAPSQHLLKACVPGSRKKSTTLIVTTLALMFVVTTHR